MKRFLPDSIAGWVIVVLISGLAASQVVTLAINYKTRSRAATVLAHFRLAERIADVVRLVNDTPDPQRSGLLASFKSGTLHVAWSGEPAVDGRQTNDERAQLFSNVMQAALWDVPWQTLRVSFGPAAVGPVVTSPGGRPSDRTTSIGRSIDEILAQHARVPVLQVALQLDDASWLNFAAPFVETPEGFPGASLLLLGLAAMVVVALSVWAVRRLTAPLETLARAAEQLGCDVDAAPLQESGARELRQATHAFNLMQARLQRFVHDRVQMTAAISHDLRTPITRLRLRAEFVDDEEQRRKMLSDLDDMEAMIDSTLAFARVEASTEAMANVDLVSLVGNVCEDRSAVTLELGTGVESRLLHACRPLAIRRCLANVVDNAVKYGRTARVRLDASPASVTFTVDDDGPGIPEADQERVFAPFERLDSSRNAELGGTGLGLSIARTIARAHGGDVVIANRSAGGLRVTIALPRGARGCMLQPTDRLPVVPHKPPPWDLRGSAWIVVLKLPGGSPARDAFLPAGLAGQGRSLVSLLIYVDYLESACGPYRELLFIPGAYPFEDGRRHFTISRIVVSTWDSVVNGRANWGIPKDRADFAVESGAAGGHEDRIRVSAEDGRELCSLRLATLRFAPRLPVPGALVPQRLRTLAQIFQGRTYYYAPSSSGWLRPGRLLEWRFDPQLFPDLSAGAVVAVCKVDSFKMRFPTARIRS